MKSIALLPDDIKVLISGYYGRKQLLCLLKDIVGFSINFSLILSNKKNMYKLLFWNMLKNYSNIHDCIGFIWGKMSQNQRDNFVKYIIIDSI